MNENTAEIYTSEPLLVAGGEAPAAHQELIEETGNRSRFDRMADFFRRKKIGILLGATAISAAATVTNTPVGELKDDVIEAAPWVGGGVAASEAMFVAGAAMMVASVREKLGNPFKIKERLPEIAQKARGNALFETGFWVNTTGAVGDFAVISAGVVAKMPPESYPMLAIPLLDLGVTIAVRKAIRSGIREKSEVNQ